MAKKTAKRKPVAKKARGRPRTLTKTIREQLEACWGLAGISDAEICESIGISDGQLRGWLDRYPDLRDIRTRKRGSVKIGYLQKLHALIDKAEQSEDYSTAAKYVCWLLEKQFPKDFGSVSQLHVKQTVKTIKLPFTMPEHVIKKIVADRRDAG